jgi:ketosteroid isomerase-like protein
MPARRFLTLALCLLGCVAIPDLAQENSNEASIHSLEMKWADAYRLRKVDVLSSLISDDYVITMEDGATLSKVGFISHTAEPSEHVDTAEIIDVKIRMHGDTAIVTGSYHESGESRGKRYDYHDRLTDVWMKIGGKWQLVASHYSLPAILY